MDDNGTPAKVSGGASMQIKQVMGKTWRRTGPWAAMGNFQVKINRQWACLQVYNRWVQLSEAI
jgi:hypothetical protein